MSTIFKVDNQLKQEFLDKQIKSTSKSYAYILRLADEYEEEIGKKLYDFNIEERDELLIVKYKNGTRWAVQSNLSPLKKYIDFCISKNLVKSNENRFAAILPADYDKYVNTQAVINSYIPKSENREMQKKIKNNQDKLVLELLSWGIRGRTEKENTLEELINFKVKDVKFETKELYITRNDGESRYITIDDYTLDLIKETIADRMYIFNNGFKKKKNDEGIYEKTNKGIPLNPTEYIFRTPGKDKYGKVDQQFFTRKLQRMQRWLEKPYLTIGNIFTSCLIEYAKQLKEEKGELIKEDYIKINERFQYGENGEKYWYKIKELIGIYL